MVCTWNSNTININTININTININITINLDLILDVLLVVVSLSVSCAIIDVVRPGVLSFSCEKNIVVFPPCLIVV